MNRMPCSITDGPQYDDDWNRPLEPDEDAAYERWRQDRIDDAADRRDKGLPARCYFCDDPAVTEENGLPECADCSKPPVLPGIPT